MSVPLDSGRRGGRRVGAVPVAPRAPDPGQGNYTIISVGRTGVHIQVCERSSGIVAITTRFLAERSSFCTKSELENKIEHQKQCFSMPILLVRSTLVMYTCACAPVGPTYSIA
eukprot:13130925-Heterocapsa_arctica.AAC.1